VTDVLTDTVLLSAIPGFERRPSRGAGTSILMVSVLASWGLDVGHILTCTETTGVSSAGCVPGMERIRTLADTSGPILRSMLFPIVVRDGSTIPLLSVRQRISSLTGGHLRCYSGAKRSPVSLYTSGYLWCLAEHLFLF